MVVGELESVRARLAAAVVDADRQTQPGAREEVGTEVEMQRYMDLGPVGWPRALAYGK